MIIYLLFHYQAYGGNFFQSAHYTVEEAWIRVNQTIEKELLDYHKTMESLKEYHKENPNLGRDMRDYHENLFVTIAEDYNVREYEIGDYLI